VPLAEFLGEDLARLELGGGAPRSEEPQSPAVKFVTNTHGQRDFGTNNGDIDAEIFSRFRNPGEIVRRQRQEIGRLPDPRIARCGENVVNALGAPQGVDDGMFAGSGSEYEYAHGRLPLRLEQTQITGLHDIARGAAAAEVVGGFC